MCKSPGKHLLSSRHRLYSKLQSTKEPKKKEKKKEIPESEKDGKATDVEMPLTSHLAGAKVYCGNFNRNSPVMYFLCSQLRFPSNFVGSFLNGMNTCLLVFLAFFKEKNWSLFIPTPCGLFFCSHLWCNFAINKKKNSIPFQFCWNFLKWHEYLLLLLLLCSFFFQRKELKLVYFYPIWTVFLFPRVIWLCS
mgnify:FL=1